MKRLLVGAGLVSLALASLGGAASAADLDYRTYEKQRSTQYEPYAPYYYHRQGTKTEEWRSTEPRYEPPPPPPRRYGEYEDPREPTWRPEDSRRPGYRTVPQYAEPRCVAKGEIRHRLKEHGWQDFQDLEVRGDTAIITARRPDGLVYRLNVDRCTGVILTAELLDDGRGWRRRNYSSSNPY